jgi:prepilin-type N-terminal cleavage/methylation domain-containing protein
MCARKHIRGQHGFTLLEMIFVVVAIGIVLAITVPAFGNFIRSSRVAGATNELLGDLHYTRSLAVGKRRNHHIEFSADAYEIKETATDEVIRRRELPKGVTCASTVDPSFYAWGLADAATITLNGGSTAKNLVLSPNGHVGHY